MQYVTSIFAKYRFGAETIWKRAVRDRAANSGPTCFARDSAGARWRNERVLTSFMDGRSGATSIGCAICHGLHVSIAAAGKILSMTSGPQWGAEKRSRLVQIALVTRTRCTMCADRSRGEEPTEASDSTDRRRYVPPHPARDFRRPVFSLPRDSVCINSRMITAHQHNKVSGERKRGGGEKGPILVRYDPRGRRKNCWESSNLWRFDPSHPFTHGGNGEIKPRRDWLNFRDWPAILFEASLPTKRL